MSSVFLEGFGNSIEGRIERLQIMRSDGTIRESKEVNIHNTVVNGGLDNILTVGGFPNGTTTNNQVIDCGAHQFSAPNSYPGTQYDIAIWLRMLWFMKLGTDTNNTITLYDMTDLVTPYVNADQESISQSHYIPTSGNLNIRGTTHNSYIEGDIHSTHRITSNSVKITEDNVTITEVGFFVGYNRTWTSTEWPNQKFSVGDMFCRINLGEHAVTLNAGERLVVTYALTEYAGASTHQAINDIHLVDGDGNPITYIDENNEEHTIGAIARTWMCDGRRNGESYDDVKMPGDFRCIHPTEERGCIIGRSQLQQSYLYTLPVYGSTWLSYTSNSNTRIIYHNWTGSPSIYWQNFLIAQNPSLIARNGTQRKDSSSPYIRQYNAKDSYGFPCINTTQMYYGSEIFCWDNSNQYLIPAGRCNDNTSNPTPYGNYTGRNWASDSLVPHPTVKAYTRGNFYRDQEWVIPTYSPDYANGNTSTLQSPTKKFNIYWLGIRNMLYKIGYFREPGNLSTFVACPIVKKAGQVLRCVFRERIARHSAGA